MTLATMAPTRSAFVLIFALLTIQSHAVTDAVLKTSQDKLDQMLDKSSSNKGLIDISGNDFEKFITRGPRPYFSMVILTALSSGNCAPCEQLNPAMEELGKMMEDQRSKISRSGELFSDSGHTDVFMVNADFANNRNVFQKLGLSTAPTLVLVPPTKSKKEIPLSKFFKSIPTKYQYSLTQGRSAEEIGNWITSTAKISWLEFGSKLELPPIQYIVAAVVVIPAFLYSIRKVIDKLRRNMLIYAVASMVVYTFVIGGGMFSSIRNTPWLHKDGNKVGYISHMSRYQFGIETYIVGALNLMGGLAAFAMIMSFRANQPEIANHKMFRAFGLLPPLIPFGVMMVAWWGIMWCYNFKNGHYNFGHVGMTG